MIFSNKENKSPVLNVKAEGAKGDGIADDTLVFKQILESAQSSAGIQVYIPSGIYRLTEELVIFSNTTILADSNAHVVRDHPGYLLINGYKNTQSKFPPSKFTRYNGNGNISIYGGIWNGNGINQKSKASIFHFGHGCNLRIEKATFLDVANSHHIEFNASKDIYITECKFLGHVGESTLNESIQLDLSKRGVTILGKDDETPCKNVWIKNCFFSDSKTEGSNHIPRAIGSHTATIGVYHQNINIENNVVENSLSFAFRAYAWKNVSITNNKLINCGAGINWRTNMVGNSMDSHTEDEDGFQTGKSQIVENGVISGNIVEGGMNNGRAIEIYGENTGKAKGLTVTGNVITLIPSRSINDAILLNYTQESTVTGNRVYGAKKSGIACRNVWSVIVTGNVIDYVEGQGIEVSGESAYSTISNNNIKKTGKNGIYVTKVDTCTITGNTIGGVNGKKDTSLYAHIRLTNNVRRISITGNTCRNLGSNYVATFALSITSGTDIVRSGNNFSGLSTSGVKGLNDGSDLQ
ncbi:right-handed parallel beta-helix repeat-containing protein [Virgibacillus proomii]|jgi:parallel beta-helix repeat protein|uniref:right-handed parallel beta-helix repeat-containing protein n=1 Tax=Virgibacillus proomii TaxID=84407 RepID=UPI000984BF93|nr:right-handed parallel beta-helix repeat-containing protein [Virgibacillus proomii]